MRALLSLRPLAAALLLLSGAILACGTPSPTRASHTAPGAASSTPESHQAPASKPGAGELCTPSQGVTDGPGNCQEGLLCCTNFHGGCGGAQPPPGEEREPCTTSHRCAAVKQCWGPPP
jgi:hypothetical protein